MTKEELLKIVDWLQENTDLAERLQDIPNSATENNPRGDYARIERWLLNSSELGFRE